MSVGNKSFGCKSHLAQLYLAKALSVVYSCSSATATN